MHDLTLRDADAGGVDQQWHQVALAVGGRLEVEERELDRLGVSVRLCGAEALDLLSRERGVDAGDRRFGLVVLEVGVDTDDDPMRGIDLLLERERGVGDLALGYPRLTASTMPRSSSILPQDS